MNHIDKNLVLDCKERLLNKKIELLTLYKSNEVEFRSRGQASAGDEGDQSVFMLAEHQFLSAQTRLRQNILEIETALARIDSGAFGVCEETDEPIEPDRLLAIPWTRLSIEGAEIREHSLKKFAR